MNGTDSASKDQTLSLLSRETNQTYIYKNEITRFNGYDKMVDGKWHRMYNVKLEVHVLPG